jgi:hypothetical protein
MPGMEEIDSDASAIGTLLGELAHDWATSTGRQLRQVLAETFQYTTDGFCLAK